MYSLFDQLYKLERIHSLIKLKATGSPEDFAHRLDISKRTLERLICQLRTQGFPINYDHYRQTYYYYQSVEFSFQLLINGEQEIHIKGGEFYGSASNVVDFINLRDG